MRDVVEQQYKVPLPLLVSSRAARIPATDLMHLPMRTRKKARTIPSIYLPSEHSIRKLRLHWASEKGTQTNSCRVRGMIVAYVTDPITLISELVYRSPFLVVGCDRGGDQTKLGVSCQSPGGSTVFIPLCVTDGKDNYEDLAKLNAAGCLPFTGATARAAHPTLFSVLNYFLTLPLRFTGLNGDWNSLSALLGLSTATATWPCLVCTVSYAQMVDGLHHAVDRSSVDGPHEYSRKHPPLLRVTAEQIVPLPLHILLGLGNRIIDAYKRVFSEEQMATSLEATKTLGTSGRAAVHTLSGKEISAWIQQKQCARLCEASGIPFERIRVLSSWLTGLYDHLLPKASASRADIKRFAALVQDMQQNWRGQTGDRPTPKLHMLTHAVAFMRRNSALGRFSESALESAHAQFNRLWEHTHRNSSHDHLLRMRRSLADCIVSQIAAAEKQ